MDINANIRKIFNFLPFGIYWLDEHNRYLDCNNYYAQLFGLNIAKTMLGKTPTEFFAHCEIKITESQKTAHSPENIFSFQRTYVFPDEIEKHFFIYQIPWFDQDSPSNKNQVFIEHDVTSYYAENKQIKGKISNLLQEKDLAEVYLANILQNLPGSVYWKDRDGVILGNNLFHAQIAGFSHQAEVIGKTDHELIWHDNAQALRANDRLVMKTGQTHQFEESAILADNQQHIFLTSKAPLRNKENAIIGVIGISLDISARKQLESDISARKKLEKELQNAIDKAEAANKVKNEFIANMSHDVKTPLSGIISFADLLSERMAPELRQLAESIRDAGKNLMMFFDNCIELCKLENHTLALNKETFNLKQLLHEILSMLWPSVKAKGLLLYIDYSADIPNQLLVSRVTLYRILLNLIGNALKFTPKGFIKICAELSQNSTPEKAIVKLSIADTGVGIPVEKQGLIFEKFSRLVPSYQGTYEGHGIGLYLVRSFVEALHGEIHLASTEGKGSEFTLVIPFPVSLLATAEHCDHDGNNLDLAALQILPAQPPPASKVRAKSAKTQAPKAKSAGIPNAIAPKTTAKKTTQLPPAKPKILLVEDNKMAQIGGKMVLEGLQCEVIIASDGQTALALFAPGKYDLVLMDIGLPDLKGYEVAQRFRSLEANTPHHVPILGLSAHATHEEKTLSLAAGIEDMFAKPLMPDLAKTLLASYVHSAK